MRLIDADLLKAKVPNTNVDIFENCRNCSTLMDWQVKELIDKQPTIDAVEVKHGEWKFIGDSEEPQDGVFMCSVCGGFLYDALIDDFKYCPYCGAKMDGEKGER